MNRWSTIRSLRLPAGLILLGVLLLLQQWNILGFDKSWPLLLILGGLLRLAERAAWTAEISQRQNPLYASTPSWQAANPYAPPPPTAPHEPWQPSSSDTKQNGERR